MQWIIVIIEVRSAVESPPSVWIETSFHMHMQTHAIGDMVMIMNATLPQTVVTFLEVVFMPSQWVLRYCFLHLLTPHDKM